MQQRILGKDGLSVSALGLGCMGMSHHRGPVPEVKAMISLLQKASELGVTFFDTAEVYGPFTNEALVGEALQGSKNNITIATKFGFSFSGDQNTGLDSRPVTIRKAAEQSLKRLRRETIDLYYQHRLDPKVPIEEVAGTIGELVKEGKVRHFGLCEVSAETIRKAHSVFPVTAIQSEYSLMWREPEETLFPVLEELNIGFVPYSPVGRAFLSGSINENATFSAENDNRADLPRFAPEALKANQQLVTALKDFGQSKGLTPSQVALGWLLAKRNWIVPIPGTTRLEHLEENLSAEHLPVTGDEWQSLEETVSQIKITGDRYPAAQQQQINK